MYQAKVTVVLERSAREVYSFLSDFTCYQTVLSHVRNVRVLAPMLIEWEISGPLGIPLIWQAEVTVLDPPYHLAWRSKSARMRSEGEMSPEPQQSRTLVTFHLTYGTPKGGILDSFFSKQFGDLQTLLGSDLAKLPAVMK